MRIPDVVLHCVVFFGIRKDGKERLAGTGFFIAAPSKAVPSLSHTYITTAKHVIVALEQKVLEGWQAFIRINLKNGSYHDVPFKENTTWTYHPAEPDSVDVAVRPWGPPEQVAQFVPIHVDIFLTEEGVRNLEVGIGDEVFFPGLFTMIKGTKKNMPIVRMGNIAMIPDEKVVQSRAFGLIDAYLVEARSIGGFSGSPVFVKHNENKFYALGLVHGHWPVDSEEIEDAISEDLTKTIHKVNMGIAIIIPASKILETLNHPDLVANRNQRDHELIHSMQRS